MFSQKYIDIMLQWWYIGVSKGKKGGDKMKKIKWNRVIEFAILFVIVGFVMLRLIQLEDMAKDNDNTVELTQREYDAWQNAMKGE